MHVEYQQPHINVKGMLVSPPLVPAQAQEPLQLWESTTCRTWPCLTLGKEAALVSLAFTAGQGCLLNT